MEATAEKTQSRARTESKSPASALKWCFEKSRDGWKNKYNELKAMVKGYKNRIAELVKIVSNGSSKPRKPASTEPPLKPRSLG
jgi:hypothetical protein